MVQHSEALEPVIHTIGNDGGILVIAYIFCEVFELLVLIGAIAHTLKASADCLSYWLLLFHCMVQSLM